MRRIKLPPREWLMVFAALIIVYLSINVLLPNTAGGFVATYVIRPAIWVLLAAFILYLPKQRGLAKPRVGKTLITIALAIALLQIYLSVIAGFLNEFGKNPNSFTALGIVINIVFIGTTLLGMELSRAWLINRLLKKPNVLLPLLISLLFTFISTPASKLPKFNGTLEAFTKYWGSEFSPLFFENLLASFLAMWGGAWPALVYRGLLEAFQWFSPLLPNLNWAMKALVGVLAPMAGIVLLQQIVLYKQNPAKAKKEGGGEMTNWLVVSVAAVLVIWFSLGIFPIKPTIIISGSMRPSIDVGDVAIVAKQNPELLKEGDIIQFRTEGGAIPTVHRIIALQSQNGKTLFVTKGDDNDAPDYDPVYYEQVVGKVVLIVPKIGWASVYIKHFIG